MEARTLAAHLTVDQYWALHDVYWALHDVAYGTPLPVAVPLPAAAPASAPTRDLRLLRGTTRRCS